MTFRPTEGSADRLGLRCDAGGANVAVHAPDAERVELCLFDETGRETARLPLPGRTGGVWHGRLEGLRPGALYGFRAHGPWAPEAGLSFNPAKLLLDPYATAYTADPVWSEALRGRDLHDRRAPDRTDSAPFMPRCVAAEPASRIDPRERPNRAWSETVIYEANVRALTKLHPGVPARLRGTYEALAHEAVVGHLKALGVTAVELLPVQAFMDERHLARKGLRNAWGYNTYGFFAPSPRYFGPAGAAGLRRAVRKLHREGIEVILDVVYNHTAESDADGPTLSFRGLDDRNYYRHGLHAPDGYVNDTGTGNTLDLSKPVVRRLVLDSLRWWAGTVGVDGFRFDLAPVLGRGPAGGLDPHAGFLETVRDDPALAGLKLIAEPWDIGHEGYRLGHFPPGWAEWNDRFRDSARRFWRGDARGAHELASGLLGSAERFDHGGRPAWSSVNFVASHDGFTLADQTLFAHRRNEANLEGNRDGHAHEVSDPMGPEGPGDAGQEAARARRRRNLLASVFLAQGTPMLRAGDEIAQSQGGNNNAYCQDDETTWIDWAAGDEGLLGFARAVSALRARLPVLRGRRFLHGALREDGLPESEWRGLDGGAPDWGDERLPGYVLILRGEAEAAPAALAFNASDGARPLGLPPAGAGLRWVCALDASSEEGAPAEALPDEIPPGCTLAFEAVPEDGPLLRLAEDAGLFRRFRRVDRVEQVAGPQTARVILHALGIEVESDAEAEALLAERRAARAARLLPQETVAEAGREGEVTLPLPLAWTIGLEDGGRIEGAAGDPIPALPVGLHELEAAGETMLIAAAPPLAPQVGERAGADRIWGVTGAIYGLMSDRGTGQGDYEDLAQAAESLAQAGAAFLGVNPLHALGAAHRGISPYSPSSRTAFSAQHLALDRIPELADCAEAREMLAAREPELARVREGELTDPALAAEIGRPVLRALFETFERTGKGTGRRKAFEAWLAEGGLPRRRFAIFEALSLAHGEDWRWWPEPLRDPASRAVTAFARESAAEVRFHAWLQWLADRQIAEAQARAKAAGMALGLYLDIAVGVRPGGAEAWARPHAFARGVSLGAPPDELSPQGQAWALAPFNPEALREMRYAPFREMLRAAMAHAGAVRIDHVIGLDRAYWAPESGEQGAYVRFPREMLLALTRIEAARTGCVVIGEDLGTVPEGLRSRLSASGLHGCAILQFEREEDAFRSVRDYAERSLAGFGTHDTPTLAGWWEAAEAGLRLSLGHMDEAGARALREERAHWRVALARLLAREGLLPEGVDPERPPERLTPGLRNAVHAALGRSGSALAALQLDDALGVVPQQNVPGTVDEVPNWRRRHPARADRLHEHPDVKAAAEAISRGR